MQTPFVSNESKFNKEEIEEITDKIQKDEILYKISYHQKYYELEKIKYIENEKNNFVNDKINYEINFAFLSNEMPNEQFIDFSQRDKIVCDDISTKITNSSILNSIYISEVNHKVYYNVNTIQDFIIDNKLIGNLNNISLNGDVYYKQEIIDFSQRDKIICDDISTKISNSSILNSNYENN